MKMNVVQTGDTLRIYGSAMQTYDQLPVGTYEVCFDKFSGFYLKTRNDLEVNEEKIYGCSERKVEKVLNSFAKVSRNFGVILSGRKGIGKSLFARVLAVKAKEAGIPMIVVTEYFPGIANFLSSIEQVVVVLFDEFDKTFSETDQFSPQEEMLPLFDGLDGGKKLFVVTCNEIRRLSTYLLNRPGRFHYHITLSNPNADEIREYMTDKLEEQYHDSIRKVVSFATQTDLTYDILRAIAFELNSGYSFEEAMEDLNIGKEEIPQFDMTVEMEDGTIKRATNIGIDLYSTETDYFWCHGKNDRDDESIRIEFRPCDVTIDIDHSAITIDPSLVDRHIDEDDFDMDDPDDKARYERLLCMPIRSIVFTRKRSRNSYKYTV